MGTGITKQHRESPLVPLCFPKDDIFESVHELTTQKMLSHYPLKANRILVTAIYAYLLAFFRMVKAFNPGDRSTDIAEHRLAYLFPGM